jgi:hypothetical protein
MFNRNKGCRSTAKMAVVIAAIMIALPLGSSALAEEPTATANSTPQSAGAKTQSESQPEKSPANTRKPAPKDKTFTPSEEISEDFSVPFPVDI